MLSTSLRLLCKRSAVAASNIAHKRVVLYRSCSSGGKSTSSSSNSSSRSSGSSSSSGSGTKRSYYERIWEYIRDAKNTPFRERMNVARLVVVDTAMFMSVFYVVTYYFVEMTFCMGPSMLPTMKKSGDLAFIDRFSYTLGSRKFEKGDVIVSICPYDANKMICKRVTATAGDVIPGSSQKEGRGASSFRVKWFDGSADSQAVSDGKEVTSLYNGEPLQRVPAGHVWLEGDNPSNSLDSRYYGPVPLALLQGRIVAKVNVFLPWEGLTIIGPRGNE